jgi:F-type H+-transporting ATPase subunit gamma
MAELEALSTRIGRVEDLRSVVRTMKAMAMVNQVQFAKARDASRGYAATVELALQALLQVRRGGPGDAPPLAAALRQGEGSDAVLVVFGSEHGLCGGFDERVLGVARPLLEALRASPGPTRLLLLGSRLAPRFPVPDPSLVSSLALPASPAGLPRLLDRLLEALQPAASPPGSPGTGSLPGRIVVVHHEPTTQATCRPQTLQLLPLDPHWLEQLERRPWASRSLPAMGGPWQEILPLLIREHLVSALHRAAVASMASENSARLMAMQAAETNIGERLTNLQQDYRQTRQRVITDELLDIVSGFEALRQQNGSTAQGTP